MSITIKHRKHETHPIRLKVPYLKRGSSHKLTLEEGKTLRKELNDVIKTAENIIMMAYEGFSLQKQIKKVLE